MKQLKSILYTISVSFLYVFIINFIWNKIEIIEFGSKQPSIADSIFATILANVLAILTLILVDLYLLYRKVKKDSYVTMLKYLESLPSSNKNTLTTTNFSKEGFEDLIDKVGNQKNEDKNPYCFTGGTWTNDSNKK